MRPLKYSRQGGRAGADKPHKLTLKEVMIGGGALITFFGVGGEVLKDWWFGDEAEVCQQAHETMLDDRLNPDIAEVHRKAYLDRQANNAIKCAARGID